MLVPSVIEASKTGTAPVLRLPHLIALLALFVQYFKPQSIWTLGRGIVQNVFSVRHRMEWESHHGTPGKGESGFQTDFPPPVPGRAGSLRPWQLGASFDLPKSYLYLACEVHSLDLWAII